MKDVKPCPYCGGEVEVIKLSKKKGDRFQPYRIECRKCHALVARGEGFPIETWPEKQQRLKEYEAYMAKQLAPLTRFEQTYDAKRRDRHAAIASRIGEDDEAYDIHDVSHRRGHQVRGGIGEFDT